MEVEGRLRLRVYLACMSHVILPPSPSLSHPAPTQALAPIELNHPRPPCTPYTKPAKMATRTRGAKASLPDNRIDTLNREAVDASAAKQVFKAVSATLSLVRVSAYILHPPVDSRR